MLEESFIYKYAKERYEYEQERKDQLNNMVSIPLGVMSVLFGCLAYFFKNLPPSNSNVILLVVFYFFFSIVNINFDKLFKAFFLPSNRIRLCIYSGS